MSIIQQILRACVLTPTPWGRGIPVCVTGAPGRGKTNTAVAVGRALGTDVEVISPGEQGEAYFGAVPAVVDNVVAYPPPSWALRLRKGILVVDELRASPLHLRPALLSLILARSVGGHKLGNDVSIVVLSNTAEQSPNGAPLDPAQANRFMHLMWDAGPLPEWLDVLKGQVVGGETIVGEEGTPDTLDTEYAKVLAAWPMASLVAYRATANTLKHSPQFRYTMPDDPTKCDGPWASERTWTLATLAAASAIVHNLPLHVRDIMLAGCVGEAAAAAMALHLTRSDLPDPLEIISGGVSWNPTGKADVDMSVLKAVSDCCNATNASRVVELFVLWANSGCRDQCAQFLAKIVGNNALASTIRDASLLHKVMKVLA